MDLEKNQMNSDNLYKEETFTDQSVGSIRQLTPVKADGSIDSSRDILFFGSAQIMTGMGPLPINFELSGATVGEAADDFASKSEVAIKETVEELEQMRRDQASQIVVPGKQPPTSGIIT